DADLVILPGSRATVADLAWLRERGLAEAVAERAARGGPVLGICGGYQMLAAGVRDDVEGGAGLVPGAGLLPAPAAVGPAGGARPRSARRRCSGCGRKPSTESRSPGTRSTTALSPRTVASRSPAGARRVRCWAPRGTASSRATVSGARCSAGSPPRADAPSTPA